MRSKALEISTAHRFTGHIMIYYRPDSKNSMCSNLVHHALSSYAVLDVVEISHAFFVHLVFNIPQHFNQLNLNPANLEATVEAE